MSSFTDYFWGEKNNGFDVLYHNMKHGQESSSEFCQFIKDSWNTEETYGKGLAKLAKYCSSCGSKGSFGPFWQVLKGLTEKLSSLHLQLVMTWQDLVKDIVKYTEEQHKKHKSMKDSESSTLETVNCIQQTIVALQKAKETYHVRCLEYEKLKRDNSNAKELEKAETKFKKSNDEYRQLVEKYANVRNEFESKMVESCKKFQDVEENHLQQMQDFVRIYSTAWENQYVLLGKVHEEFRCKITDLTVDRLIEKLIQTKTTGQGKPGPIEFVETDLSALPPPTTPNSNSKEIPVLEKPVKEGGGFLGGIKSKTKKKKIKKKQKSIENDENKNQEVMVDADGYTIPPVNRYHVSRDDSTTSSEDDSDAEEKKKIKVNIRPIYGPNGSAENSNLDDILTSMAGINIKLSPTPMRRNTPTNDDGLKMKKSRSYTETIGSSSTGNHGVLGLSVFEAASSTASTPTGGNYTFPSPLMRDCGGPNSTSVMSTPLSSPNMSDSPFSDILPISTKQRSQTPTGAPLIPGPPPSRTPRSSLPPTATGRPAGRQTPDPLRTGSVRNVSFNTSTTQSISSRGPSPLTIGMSDNIPLAVAFSETINAYMTGADETRYMVRMSGDMMISFPAGIVRALMDNPSPSQLSFRLNPSALENILVNKQLVAEDMLQNTTDCRVYQFDMTALIDHLKKEAEQNKTALYFNIDILKYQVRNTSGVQNVPLHLVSYWNCRSCQTDFRLDYKYNGAATAANLPLTNVTVLVPVNGEVTNMQSFPTATWQAENKRAIWKVGDIHKNKGKGQGCLRAKFELAQGVSTPGPVAVQFMCDGSTLSGVDFELVGTGYRISLVKKRFLSGKYLSEASTEPKQA